MEIIKWYKYVVFKNYANFSGRASRAEYWWVFLANILISLLLSYVDEIIGIPIISSLFSLLLLIPGLAVAVRRMHDIGKSGWALLVGLIPIVGIIILIVWLATEGEHGENEYGPVPPSTPPSV